jgi:hypothetical protein
MSSKQDQLSKAYFAAQRTKREEKLAWGVFGYTKKGALRKGASWKCASKEEAIATAEEMTRLNGEPFVAKAL